jgi:hypothetical protein
MVDSVRKVTEVLTALLQDGQGDSAISEQDVREAVISTSPPAFTGMGFYLDSLYTIGSPLSLAAATRTKLTNNGLLVKRLVNLSGAGFSEGADITLALDPWDTATNKIVADYLDAFYVVQLAFKATTSNANNFLTIEVDVGGATGAFLFQTQVFAKGIGIETDFVFTWNLFAGVDFLTNGAEIYVTADNTADLYEFGMTINQVGRPHI